VDGSGRRGNLIHFHPDTRLPDFVHNDQKWLIKYAETLKNDASTRRRHLFGGNPVGSKAALIVTIYYF